MIVRNVGVGRVLCACAHEKVDDQCQYVCGVSQRLGVVVAITNGPVFICVRGVY